ncbi:hypothetical protein AAFN47_04100 [Hoeflea sp. CAU 1731]
MKVLLATTIVCSLLGGISLVNAEELDCTCTTKQASNQAYPVVGKIADSSGSVMYSGTTGFIEGKAGTEITSGSQINVGPNGKASVHIGSTCNLAAAQNTEISILQPEGKDGSICVKVTEANFETATLGTESSTHSQANPNGGGVDQSALVALGAAAGIVAITCIGWCQDDNGPPPASR